MKKVIAALILFLFPSFLAKYLVRLFGYHIRGRVGFSFLLCDRCEIGPDAVIQSGCLIMIPDLQMEQGARIKRFTLFKGGFSVLMHEKAVIKGFSKITNSTMLQYRKIHLEIGKGSILGISSLVDMTGNVTIGDYTVFAGSDAQIWTHSYYHSKTVPKRFRIDGDVVVGNNNYIGSRCILTSGVTTADNISVGAGTVISKSLEKPGLYVNQPLRFLEFDPEEKIASSCEPVPEAPVEPVYRKRPTA